MEKLFLFCILLYSILSLLFYKRIRGKAYVAPVVPLLMAAGQAGYQMYQGYKQNQEADKQQNYLPPGMVEAENLARTQANATRYAGQDQDETNIRRTTADTFQNIKTATTSSGELVNAASKLHGAQGRAMDGVAKTGQIFKQNSLDRYRQTQAQKAGLQMQSRMYAENLRGAASKNQYNAVNSLAGGIAMAGNAHDWNKTFGKNTNPSMMGWSPVASSMPGGMNPNMMSTQGWNPMAFSAGGNFYNNR